jgi:hypothetical protein
LLLHTEIEFGLFFLNVFVLEIRCREDVSRTIFNGSLCRRKSTPAGFIANGGETKNSRKRIQLAGGWVGIPGGGRTTHLVSFIFLLGFFYS